MSIFAISDLHLSLSTDKPMDVFGNKWDNYEDKMKEKWNKIVTDDDLVIIPGDISWAMYLEDTKADFKYIDSLKGQKLLLRGNHDYWWTTLNKMEKYVEENEFKTINFLKNTAYKWGDTAICGTRGWTINYSDVPSEDKKIYDRERQRLILSLENAKSLGVKNIISALHFPPIDKEGISRGFMDILEAYGVSRCVYGHLHGDGYKNATFGEINGVKLNLVSCDFLDFTPFLLEN